MRPPAQGRRVASALLRALGAPKRLGLRCLVLFAAVLVVLPAWAGAAQKYQCRYSKRVMTSCCCKAKHQAAEQRERSPQASAPGCCDTLRQAARSASASVRDSATPALEANWESSLVPIATQSPTRLRKVSTEASIGARAGPAIFLRDCRLLT